MTEISRTFYEQSNKSSSSINTENVFTVQTATNCFGRWSPKHPPQNTPLVGKIGVYIMQHIPTVSIQFTIKYSSSPFQSHDEWCVQLMYLITEPSRNTLN